MKKIRTLLFSLLFVLALTTLNCKGVSAKTQSCCTNIFKNIVIQKGKKIKLYSNSYSKIKWSCKSKKAKINKKGILKAKKKGMVKVLGKTKTGKKITVKVTIKKKIVKANSKTVQVITAQETGQDSFKFLVKNNSDEGVWAVWICGLKEEVNGTLSYVPKKQILTDTFPHIYLEPGKTYFCPGYNLDNYVLNNGRIYVLELNVTPGYDISLNKRTFLAQGKFQYKKANNFYR